MVAPPSPSSNDISLDFGAGSASGNIQVNGVNQCGNGPASSLPVNVFSRPNPGLTSSVSSTCVGSPVTYTTEAGMTGYQWVYPLASANLVSGGTSADNTITLSWTVAGTSMVSVNYNDANNCPASSPSQLPVNVHSLPTPVISGNQNLCIGTNGVIYTTEAGMNNY